MKKSTQTKRALIPSLLAVILCAAMLVGTTFAWFTDTASTSVNKIEAGTLDVKLEMKNASDGWVSAEGETLDFVKAAGGGEQEVLWEPGVTYTLPELRIVNNGNLALKYKVLFNAVDTNAENLKLAEVINVTMTIAGVGEKSVGTLASVLENAMNTTDPDGYAWGALKPEADSGAITLKFTMDTAAGNEYQDLSINKIAVTVLAKQDTVEYDSTNNTYDAKAEYPWDGTVATEEELTKATKNENGKTTVEISSAPLLAAFVKAVNSDASGFKDATVTLENDIDLGGQEWTPLTWYKGGSTDDAGSMTFDGNGHTISNFKVTAATDGEEKTGFFGDATRMTIKNLTIRGATVTGYKYVGALVGYGQATTIENCKVENSTVTGKTWTSQSTTKGSEKVGAIAGALVDNRNSVKNCTVTGCTIQGYSEVGGLIGRIVGTNSAATNNTVSDTTIIWDNTNMYDSGKQTQGACNVNKVVGENYNSAATVSNNSDTDVTIETKTT